MMFKPTANIKKKISFIILLLTTILHLTLCSQQIIPESSITVEQLDGHIKILASDSLRGRASFSEDIWMAEAYIAKQFREAGLKSFDQFPGYRHEFTHTRRSRRNPEMDGKEYQLTNIIGYLEGTDPHFKDEFVMFGAHHDHIGVFGDTEDNIYNGAEDNASGTTAVITLAQYFAKKNENKRSIIFVTFTAEEMGLIGSRQLVEDLPVDKEKIVAMINFEMIGKPSEDGKTICYLTGWARSDIPLIMQEALGDDPMTLIQGPEITDRLFFASDNISFARAGIVAHTLAGIRSTNDPLAHNPDDEYETLDIESMTRVIRGTARASRTLISGEKTPKVLMPLE